MLDEYVKLIDSELELGEVSGETITAIANEFQSRKKSIIELQERYRGKTPILDRTPSYIGGVETFEKSFTKAVRVDDSVNNKLVNAFDADIIDTKVGYMFGKPISYDVNKTNVDGLDDKDHDDEDDMARLKEVTNNFNLRNNIADKDSEMGKQSTITGYSARLISINKEGEPVVNNVDSDKAIIMSATGTLSEPTYSLRFYSCFEFESHKGETIKKVVNYAELYRDKQYTVYKREGEQGNYKLHEESRPHGFSYNPLFGAENNSELMGDVEKVITLIDAYDGTMSDISSEITSQRLSYMVLRGFELEEEDVKALKRSGVFNLFGEKDSVGYLTKDVNNLMAENHLETLSKNIMRFAKTVNFDDDVFGGNATGVSLAYKLISLENKCITSQRKFESSLRYQYKLLCDFWAFAKKGIMKDDYLKMRFGFKRSLPADIEKAIKMVSDGGGKLSNNTLLTLSGAVDDADEEMLKVRQEEEEQLLSVYKTTDEQ